MTKTFTAAILAFTIAITGFSAAPARAGSDEVVLGVLGALAIFALAKDADDRRDHKKKERYKKVERKKHYYRRTHAIPRSCIRRTDRRHGSRLFVTKRCLAYEGYTRRVPQRCAFTHDNRRRDYHAYSLNCLKNRGHRVEARR